MNIKLQILWIALSFINTQAFAVEQGVYIAPVRKLNYPKNVRKTISDSYTPVIEVGPSGPTVVTFPEKVIGVASSSKAYTVQTHNSSQIQKAGGGVLFNKVVISVSKALIENESFQKHYSKNEVSVPVTYIFKENEYTHDINIILAPKKRRSHVTLIPFGKNINGADEFTKVTGKTIVDKLAKNGFTLE